MFSIKGVKNAVVAAFAGVLGLSALSAHGAVYVTASLLGSHSAGGPFTSSLSVAPGDTVFYQIHAQLAPQGTTNSSQSANNGTIADWKISHDAPSTTFQTSGLSAIRFTIDQAAADPIQVNLATPVAATTTNNLSWSSGVGATGGTPTANRGANNDLVNVLLTRSAGEFDGIAGTDSPVGTPNPQETLEDLVIATGQFTVSTGGSNGTVRLDLNGLTPGTLAELGMRWYRSDGTTVNNFNPNVTQAGTAAAGGNPLIAFNNLTLTPEPTTLSLLGLSTLALGLRRRRA